VLEKSAWRDPAASVARCDIAGVRASCSGTATRSFRRARSFTAITGTPCKAIGLDVDIFFTRCPHT
jgi:hypothetical protein